MLAKEVHIMAFNRRPGATDHGGVDLEDCEPWSLIVSSSQLVEQITSGKANDDAPATCQAVLCDRHIQHREEVADESGLKRLESLTGPLASETELHAAEPKLLSPH